VSEFFTPQEVADQLKVKRRTVTDWIRQGQLTGVRVGRNWRIKKEDLETFIDSRTSTALSAEEAEVS